MSRNRHLAVIENSRGTVRDRSRNKISFSNTGGGDIETIGQVRRARAKSTSARRRRHHQPPPRQCTKKRAAETDQGRCVPPHHGDRRGPPSTIGATHGASNTKRADHADRAQPPSHLISPTPTTTSPLRTRAEHAMWLLDNSSPSQRTQTHFTTAQLEEFGQKKISPGEPTHISAGNHPH